jgi:hypothetical protein
MTQTTDEPKKQRPSHSGIGDRYSQREKLSQRTGISDFAFSNRSDRYSQREKLSQRTGIGGILRYLIGRCYPMKNNYSFRRAMKIYKPQAGALYRKIVPPLFHLITQSLKIK